MGFNMHTVHEPDSFWADGKVAEKLKEIKCGLLRFPDGEPTSYTHWNDPISRGEVDTWDPKFDGKKGKPEEYTDVDEYMVQVRKIGCEPLIGINMESGAKYHRDEEGLAEAKALIQHCIDRKYNVKYWFLDNETYLRGGANHMPMTAEQYANYCNRYAEVLKSVDPNIQLVANWERGWSKDWETILTIAGKNIDIADMHMYWRGGGVSWPYWLQHNPMAPNGNAQDKERGITKLRPYSEIIRDFRESAKAMGKDIKVASMEWDIGPRPQPPLTPFQGALMQAEEFGQFINAGMDMACLWPMHWPGSFEYRELLNNKTREFNINWTMFKMYSDVLGQDSVNSSSDVPLVPMVAARSKDGNTLYIYLLRKSEDAPALSTEITINGFVAKSVKAISLTADHYRSQTGKVIDLPVSGTDKLTIDLPAHSFTEVILKK